MLSKAKTLIGYKLDSRNGEMGKVENFYFDDRHWTIRYLVADSGNWLPGRQVLISPYALLDVSAEKQRVAIDLTKKQIEDSPSLESDLPVSRQFEEAYHGYYGWPTYWSGPFIWGTYSRFDRGHPPMSESGPAERAWDPHLRSTREVSGYHIQATDGEIGHVVDFILDDENWTIRYLIIDTRNWWPGKKILISPPWIERINWPQSKVFVNLSRERIRSAPEYTDESLLTREYEVRLHRHYDRQGYWDE